MSYFDILPLEVRVIICGKFNDDEFKQMERSDILEKELSDRYFWNLLIKLTMPDIDLRYIPECKYKYEGKSNMVAITNYISLYEKYNLMKKNLKSKHKGEKYLKYRERYNISCFRDASVITLEYTKLKLPRETKDKICTMFNDMTKMKSTEVSITINNSGECHINIKKMKFQIDITDLLNIGIHVMCHTDSYFMYD